MSSTGAINCLGIYCSDPTALLLDEIERELSPPRKTTVLLGWLGGPVSLANPSDLPTDFAFTMDQIRFARWKFPNITDVMLFGHDCGFYAQIEGRKFTLVDKMRDMAKAANFLKGRLLLNVAAFFKLPDQVGFKTVS